VVDGLVSVITRVDLEHTEHLGNTVERIAREKAGIIKRSSRAVTVDQAALPVIEARCREVHAPLTVLGRDVHAERIAGDLRGQRVRVRGSFGSLELGTPLLGSFQIENLGLAGAALGAIGARVYACRPKTHRAYDTEEVATAFRPYADSVATPSVREAIDAALAAARPDDIVLITGSIYTAGEALDHLGIRP